MHRITLSIALLIVTASASPAAEPDRGDAAEFSFVRLAYASNRMAWYGRGRHFWQTDMPEAELHLLEGIDRLTRVDTSGRPLVVTALSEELFDYPWLYAVEVGYWQLSPEEAERLREYLLRGGFLVVDDFHGTLEWASFLESMTRVFPDRPIVDIPEDDEAFHVHFDLDQRIQIPSAGYISRGVTWEKDGFTPHWRGIYDDDGRLMVAINFNMDLGDAWEHADWPEYPEAMTSLAYRFGVNYVIYAMTH